MATCLSSEVIGIGSCFTITRNNQEKGVRGVGDLRFYQIIFLWNVIEPLTYRSKYHVQWKGDVKLKGNIVDCACEKE